MTPTRVVVVGAGVTGLAAAVSLQDAAHRAGLPLALTVLDAAPAPGGHAQTVRHDGFLVEAGPNGFLNREPATLDLVARLGLEPRLVEARPEAKRRYIVRDGALRQVPDGPATLLSSPALTWRGKLRLLGEPFAAGPPPGEESVHAFATRRLGAEAAEMLVDAAVSGISAGDSRRLSVAAQFPRLAEMERTHGSLLKAMFAKRPADAPRGPAKLLSFDDGLGVLTGAMAARLGASLALATPARAVTAGGGGAGWRVTTADGRDLAADHVVVATPARHAATLLAAVDPALAGDLSAIEYAGLAVVALAYGAGDVPRALDGYGYLTTRPEGLATLGVVWESSLFPGRAPDGAVLLRVMLGGARRPDLASASPDDLLRLARTELGAVLGVSAEPRHTWVHRWPEAIAQYTLGHRERCAAIRARTDRHPGLWLCGSSYDGVSFNDAIASGCRAAERIAGAAGDSRGAAPGVRPAWVTAVEVQA